jgi:putative flippase GtrA
LLSRFPQLRSRAALWDWFKELCRFGAVGAIAFVVDIGGFNLLTWAFGGHQITAKTISGIVSTLVAYVGNRYWTFGRDKATDTRSTVREFWEFMAVNALAVLVQDGCLGLSHHVLHWTGPLADNIMGNIIGTGLGTIVRYACYKLFVFKRPATPAASESLAAGAEPEAPGTAGE